MGRNASFFATPDEVAEVVAQCCSDHHWDLWMFPEGTATGPVHRLSRLDDAGRRLVWIGSMRAPRSEWNTRDASIEDGFACVVRPTLIKSPLGSELTLTEVFHVGGSTLGRLAPFSRLKAALSARSVGLVSAVSDISPARQTTRIRYTASVADMWRNGVVLRQVVGGRVQFVPSEAAS